MSLKTKESVTSGDDLSNELAGLSLVDIETTCIYSDDHILADGSHYRMVHTVDAADPTIVLSVHQERNGKRNGAFFRVPSQDGSIHAVLASYNDGDLDGALVVFDKNDHLERIDIYRDGKLDRPLQKVGESQLVTSLWNRGQWTMTVGHHHGYQPKHRFDMDGTFQYMAQYVHGKRHGVCSEYRMSGARNFIATYKRGQLDGVFLSFGGYGSDQTDNNELNELSVYTMGKHICTIPISEDAISFERATRDPRPPANPPVWQDSPRMVE